MAQQLESPMKLQSNKARVVYLVTYSQADMSIVPNRVKFADIVVGEFNRGSPHNRVLYWVCSKEKHRNRGSHFHLALKLDGVLRWAGVKNRITASYGIVLNFRDFRGYYPAYTYVTKKDPLYLLSENHPAEIESPQTAQATEARSERAEKRESRETPCATNKRKRKLQPSDLYNIITKNNIKTDLQLCRHAMMELNENNNPLLSDFIMTRDDKRRNSMIATAWKLNTAAAVIERNNKSRLEILEESFTKPCIPGCASRWLTQAQDTLLKNDIDISLFTTAVKTALVQGRGKHRNVMLVGTSNCGKTFLLKPLKKIFNCFVTPTKGTFNWVGAENSECVFLNDFRWSEKVIPWSDLLNLLEGEPIQVPVPKTHYAENPMWTKDTPIFATSKTKIRKYECGQVDEVETEMMDSRWRVFVFRHKFDVNTKIDLEPCPRCFAELIL